MFVVIGIAVIFAIFIAVLLGLIILKAIGQWKKNKHSPLLTVAATVVAKRQYINYSDDSSYTRYYATFQFENGDRLELVIPHSQIGYLVEGDRGRLSFQGTWFRSFERT